MYISSRSAIKRADKLNISKTTLRVKIFIHRIPRYCCLNNLGVCLYADV